MRYKLYLVSGLTLEVRAESTQGSGSSLIFKNAQNQVVADFWAQSIVGFVRSDALVSEEK